MSIKYNLNKEKITNISTHSLDINSSKVNTILVMSVFDATLATLNQI